MPIRTGAVTKPVLRPPQQLGDSAAAPVEEAAPATPPVAASVNGGDPRPALTGQFEVAEVADTPTADKVSALIYGEPGVGKTVLAETAPGPRLWLNFDHRGLASINRQRGSGNLLPRPFGEPLELIADWETALAVLQWLEEWAWSGKMQETIQTLVVDTVTSAAKRLDEWIIRTQVTSIARSHPKALSQTDFGLHAVEILEFVDRCLRLPVNVVVNAHVKADLLTDPITQAVRKERLPDLGGRQAPRSVAAMFSLVGLYKRVPIAAIDIPEEEADQYPDGYARVLVVAPAEDTHQAKARVPYGRTLPPDILSPNLTEIFQVMVGDVN